MDNLDYLEMDDAIIRHSSEAYYGRIHSAPTKPSCRYCGKGGLMWKDVGGGKMRLTEPTKLHTCEAYLEAHGL